MIRKNWQENASKSSIWYNTPMKNIFFIVQIVVAVLLIFLILIQAKGVGLGRAFGGGGEFYKSRRGVEKVIFYLTIVLTAIFLITSVATLLVS